MTSRNISVANLQKEKQKLKSKFYTRYKTGDTGPAGGLIFITPETEGNTTGKYFEVAPVSVEAQRPWAQNPYNLASVYPGYSFEESYPIGRGYQNTQDIIAQGNIDPALSAAAYCVSVNIGGYQDWFLPSIEELKLVQKNVIWTGRGGFTLEQNYWSSSEINAVFMGDTYGWGIRALPIGFFEEILNAKSISLRVRPVRMFSPEEIAAPENGQFLKYNGNSWVNSDIGPNDGNYKLFADTTERSIATPSFRLGQLEYNAQQHRISMFREFGGFGAVRLGNTEIIGSLTTPQHPAWYAHSTTNVTYTNNQRLTFQSVSVNRTNSYNSSTSRFTCTSPGLYFVQARILTQNNTSAADCRIAINDVAREAYAGYAVNGGVINSHKQGHVSGVVSLSFGDTVSIVATGTIDFYGASSAGHCAFMGYYIG
jgi:hypothetical protein